MVGEEEAASEEEAADAEDTWLMKSKPPFMHPTYVIFGGKGGRKAERRKKKGRKR